MRGANDSDRRGVSIVVLTLRAGVSIKSFADRIDKALAGTGHVWELIVADGASETAIEAEIAELAKRLSIRIDVCPDVPRDFSRAIVRALALARYRRIVVMDAETSHSPQYIDGLLSGLEADCDMVIASRFVEGASVDSVSEIGRRIGTWAVTLLVRPLVKCKDPMSGFFAVDKCALPSLSSLRLAGKAIGLELIVRAGLRVAEAPIPVRERDSGRERMSFHEQWLVLRHLSRLYRFKLGPAAQLASFALVGASGFAVDLAGYLGLQSLGLGHTSARLVSFWPAVTWNWWLNRRFTFQERPKRPVVRQWTEFIASSLVGFAANVGTYVALTANVGFFEQERIAALICGVGVGATANFLIASKYVYPQGSTVISDPKTRV